MEQERLSTELKRNPQKSYDILRNSYPPHILRRMSISDSKSSDVWEGSLYLIFMDIVGYTEWSSQRTPYQIYHMLKKFFELVEMESDQNITKLETVGDSWVGTSTSMLSAMNMCSNIILKTPRMRHVLFPNFDIRIGIHYGPILNVVSSRWQLFGHSMNVASRLETTSPISCIHMTSAIYEQHICQNPQLFTHLTNICRIHYTNVILKGVGKTETVVVSLNKKRSTCELVYPMI